MKSFIRTTQKKLQHSINYVFGNTRNRALILLYHRIADFQPDAQLLCVSPRNFEDHLKTICELYHPIHLEDLTQYIKSNTLPTGSVIITFDDGYIDNLTNAAPLLEQYGVPATIFVTSGFVDKHVEMVSDVLERIFLAQKKLPRHLELTLEGKTYNWALGEDDQQVMTWNVTQKNDPNSRYRCYRDLHKLLRPMSSNQREQIQKQLFDWAGLEECGRPDHRIMNSEEIRIMNKSELIEIGSHGISHTMLAKQVPDVQRQEIFGSKERLETILGSPVTSFSYPYGGADAVDARTISLVQAAGFNLACDNVCGTAGMFTGLYSLPRFLVRDWNHDEFQKQMKNAFLY
jgi:peptidoglycan/xylan/chitin deacetylase (PgdA/CDA1 family)